MKTDISQPTQSAKRARRDTCAHHTRLSYFSRAVWVALALTAASMFAAPMALAQTTTTSDASANSATATHAMPGRGPVTNLPLPRYVSLKTNEGNVRRGPSMSHRIDWIFTQRGMPLRVTAEFENWRRVEDREGAGGWVHYTLISGVRAVIIDRDMLDLRTKPDDDAKAAARAEIGAVARLESCTLDWCQISADGAKGWVRKTDIWGVDPEEIHE